MSDNSACTKSLQISIEKAASISATNLRIKILPIAIGRVPHESAAYSLATLISYANQYQNGRLKEVTQFLPIKPYVDSDTDIAISYAIQEKPDVVALSSFIWTHNQNLYIAQKIKEALPNTIIIIGGPHIPKREQACAIFMSENPFIDIAARGEGELVFCDLIDAIYIGMPSKEHLYKALETVNGITFRKENNILFRTPDQRRFSEKELAGVISPFTSGVLDSFLEPLTNDRVLPFETNRGCPYGCTFCDWGSATLEKVNKIPMERILSDIEFLGKNKIEKIFITDANFGMLARDKDIAGALVACKEKYGYPKHVTVNYSKNTNQRVVDVIDTLWQGNLVHFGLLSAQTTDQQTLDNIDRWNIKPEQYAKLLKVFREKHIPVAADLMIGLPGQNTQSFINDMQFFFERKVLTNAYWTAILPNSPMADPSYKKKYSIETDTKNVIQTTYSFSKKDAEACDNIFRAYQFLFRAGILRYFLYFLQVEQKVSGIDFIYQWTIVCQREENRYPISSWAFNNMLNTGEPNTIHYQFIHWKRNAVFFFDNLDSFYQEIKNICQEIFSVVLTGSGIETIFDTQKAIMPKLGINQPCDVYLQHDVVSYFKQINDIISLAELPVDFQPLYSFPPTTLHLPSPGKKHGYGFMSTNAQKREWEVDSALRELGI
ncbi:MAG TPA: radical SAM protein [Pseudomonadales bacterium]|nr:radical SAM protein [Pseudomonadales bacterium]